MRIIIVGGGVVGLLTALELATAGCQVSVIEKNPSATEASWAGGGIVSPLYPWRYPPAVTALAQLAQQMYPALAQRLLDLTGMEIELNGCGMLMLEADDQRDAMVWARQYGQQISRLNAEEIQQLAPMLRSFSNGLWLPSVANVRNPRLLKALAQALACLNVKYIHSTEVTHWQCEHGQITGVETCQGQVYQADHYIVTSGAWTSGLLMELGIDIPVRPMKGQMILYKLPEPCLSRIVLHQGHYLIPRLDGHILCGSTLEDVGFDKQTTGEAGERLQRIAANIMPMLAHERPVRQWAGLRPASPNGIPFIGRSPQYANLWVNAGQFRNGLVLAPASARLLTDMLLQRMTCVNPEPYQML